VGLLWHSRQSKRLSSLRTWVRFSHGPMRVSQRSAENRGFSPGGSGFFPQGKLTGQVRISIVKKVISQLL
jgi:hypothetical protein